MKTQSKALPIIALLVAATAYWVYLVFSAHLSSTHNISSTSQLGAFKDLLFGSACVLAFAATGISLWHHRAAAVIIRILVAALSVVGAAFTVRMFFDYGSSFNSSSLRPAPYIAGSFLLLGYFVATLLTALPFVSVQRAIRLRFILHFGILPAALCAMFLLGYPRDHYSTFSAFGLYLIAALPFVLLSFRMYELRQTFDRNA